MKREREAIEIFPSIRYNRNMETAFEQKIDLSQFKKGQTVCVAYSGGADSSALLHYLNIHRKRLQISLQAIHVEHGIRKGTSQRDADFAQETCDRWDVPLYVIHVDALKEKADKKITLEEAARALRYDAFHQRLQQGADAIVVAHHADDAAETVFMRIMRGTGISGLCPMKNELPFLRPLLSITREEIEEYLYQNSIPFTKDESNDQTEYTRNYIRHIVFPLLEKRFPLFKSLSTLSQAAKEDEDFIDSFLTPPQITAEGWVKLAISAVTAPLSVSARNIKNAFKMLGVFQDIEKRHIPLICALCEKENGKYLTMPHGVIIYKAYDFLIFQLSKQKSEQEIVFQERFIFDAKTYTLSAWKGEGLRFDADKIPPRALVRHRQEGDRFTPYKGKEKSLSDYFIDKKIPRALRDSCFVIAVGSQVLYIHGVEISDDIKTDEKSKNIVCLREEFHDE